MMSWYQSLIFWLTNNIDRRLQVILSNIIPIMNVIYEPDQYAYFQAVEKYHESYNKANPTVLTIWQIAYCQYWTPKILKHHKEDNGLALVINRCKEIISSTLTRNKTAFHVIKIRREKSYEITVFQVLISPYIQGTAEYTSKKKWRIFSDCSFETDSLLHS